MEVLVACEFSGIVRDAFIERGHNAISCDLLPTERPGPHYQGDVRDILNDGWDLMIAHPPCTYLSKVGAHYLNTEPGRIEKMEKAIEFFALLWNSNVEYICIENPIMHIRARKKIGMYHQIAQPFHFGDRERKATCLWLKNLPPLMSTKIMDVKPSGFCVLPNGRKFNYYFTSMQTGSKNRSRSFPGIAAAMAAQWGKED